MAEHQGEDRIPITYTELKNLTEKITQLEHDAMTLALRLIVEDENSFAPETAEVMGRWRPTCLKRLGISGEKIHSY